MKKGNFLWLLGLICVALRAEIVVQEDVPKPVKRTPLALSDIPTDKITDRRRQTFQVFQPDTQSPPQERRLRDSFGGKSWGLRARSTKSKLKKIGGLISSLVKTESPSERKLWFWRRRRRNNRRRNNRRRNNRRRQRGRRRGGRRQNHQRGSTVRQGRRQPAPAHQAAVIHMMQQFIRQQHAPQHHNVWRPQVFQRQWHQPAPQRVDPPRLDPAVFTPPPFIEPPAAAVPQAQMNSGPTNINPPFHRVRHDLVRFRNQVRHIQLIHSDQHLVDRLWKHLHVNLARFRNEARRARRYNGVILRHNMQNRLRNDRNMLRQSSLRMEDQIYRENARLFRQLNQQARMFENVTRTNTTLFFDSAKDRASNYDTPAARDIFY